jgi:hypothetical protein
MRGNSLQVNTIHDVSVEHVFDLQYKIYLSMLTGEAKSTLKLQKLLIKEHSAHYTVTKHTLYII